MTREHPPCSACAKFKEGYCADFDRPAEPASSPCVLFLAKGSREAWMAARSEQHLLAEIARKQQSRTKETK
jgi:hypothetical protein